MPGRDPWLDLDAELDAWSQAGRQATFWWRDDDAVAPTPALVRLLELAHAQDVRPALAVIPIGAQPALFALLSSHPAVVILQHGYAHTNHAPAGAKKSELGGARPAATVLRELAEGRVVLASLSAGRAQAVLVPPWNRIDALVAAELGSIGIAGLSTVKPRAARRDARGVVHANTHVDPVDWRARRAGGDGSVGSEAALGAAIAHLQARRLGQVDAGEPTGLLTHHLVMDDATWAFAAAFMRATRRHKAARWLDPASVFDAGA
ncbi:MAG: polysaccharide deacetylase family protein [Alphaproteobacteria bacterium]|nr:polysaccharide deacetylase family protein [Alphaproteobacteria bacterium]